MRAKIGVVAIMCFVLLSGCGNGAQQRAASKGDSQQQYAQFAKWGLSFDYPKEWREHPADRVGAMKDYMARELDQYGRHLQELAILVGPNDEVALIVSKYTTPVPMTPSEFIEERNRVYADAQRAGDVTKVNLVKEETLAKLPAIEEDVERSNGGRGRTYKLIDGVVVFEISFIVNDASQFPKYSDMLDHLVSNMTVAETSERPDSLPGRR